MKFSTIVGNPPYQESITTGSSNKTLGKQLFPYYIMLSMNGISEYVSLVTPSRWFTGNGQDKSFIKLREFIRQNNHIKVLMNYKNENEVFDGVEIKGGVSYFLSQRNYQGKVTFTNTIKNKQDTQIRDLFIDDIDIIISDGYSYPILKKVLGKDFTPLTTITTGRNPFGIIGKVSVVEAISKVEKFKGSVELRCMSNEIRYINPNLITKNRDIFERYKVFISKSAGSPKSDLNIIGRSYVGMSMSACTDSLISIGKFNTELEAINLSKYLQTKFLRFLVSILKSSHNVTQIVYKFVPIQDFTNNSDIDWKLGISNIDKQLYNKYNLTQEEIHYIEASIKSMP